MQLVEITIAVDEIQVAHASVLRVHQARLNSQIGTDVALDIAVPN